MYQLKIFDIVSSTPPRFLSPNIDFVYLNPHNCIVKKISLVISFIKEIFLKIGRRVTIILFLLAISITANILLIVRLSDKTVLINNLSEEIKVIDSERARLRDFSYNLLNPTSKPEIKYELSDQKYNAVFNLKFYCPQGWTCTFNEYGFSLNDPGYYGNSYANIKILDDRKDIDNSKYKSAIDWYEGLLNREPEAIGSNIEHDFSPESVRFYEYYNLSRLRLSMFGNKPGLIAPLESMSGGIDILIPNNNKVYRFILDHYESEEFISHFLSLIEFVN